MKILLANYRYFVSGGPERYMFNAIEALQERGQEVIPFSIRHDRSRPTPYSRYFVGPLGNTDEIYFSDHHRTPTTLWRTLKRLFYDPEIEQAATKLVEDTNPDIAYVLHYLRKFSPALLVGLKKAGLPIVVRLSDYALLCPEAHCLRDGVPCELCVEGSLWSSVRYRCVQDSLVASVLNALATLYHRFRRYFDLIDVFVTTNQFMYDMMMSAGFSEEGLRCIPTFVDGERFHPLSGFSQDGYIAYVGRLNAIKGVHVLIDAINLLHNKRPDLNLRLKLAGSGDDDYEHSIRQKVHRNGLRDIVEFEGKLDASGVAELLGGASVSVVPSLWYENLPNAVLESYACGTPVLASGLGSLSECVQEGETGYLFEPGDVSSLTERLEHCLDHPREVGRMARKARQVAEELYSPERHIAMLERLFDNLGGID